LAKRCASRGILSWVMSSSPPLGLPSPPFIHQTRGRGQARPSAGLRGPPRCGRTLSVRPPARRWLIVAALFMVTFGIATPLAAYGVFLPVLAESFAWSRGAISTALSINLLLGGLAGFGIGALADRHGPRGMLALTVALAGAGFALVSMVDALWHLYLFVGVMGVTLGYALADRRQWYLNFAWLLLGGLAFMVSVHIVPFARDQGIGLAGASLALTAYGVGSVGGRLAAGVVSDRRGTITTIRVAYVIETLALVTLLWIPSREALLASLVMFGAGFAASDTMIVKVIPDVFGMRALGAIMGVLTLGWRSGAALGPAAAGFLYDLTGSYTVPFGAAPVAVLVSWGLFALGTSRRPGWAPRPPHGPRARGRKSGVTNGRVGLQFWGPAQLYG